LMASGHRLAGVADPSSAALCNRCRPSDTSEVSSCQRRRSLSSRAPAASLGAGRRPRPRPLPSISSVGGHRFRIGRNPSERCLSGPDPDGHDPVNRECRPRALRSVASGRPAAAVGERRRGRQRGRVSTQPQRNLRHRRRAARRRRSNRRERTGVATTVGSGR
jgi:hypothetical protein